MRAIAAVALCPVLGACVGDASDEITWYEMVSVTEQPLPVTLGEEEALDGWLEVHPDQMAVWRMTRRDVSEEGDGLAMPFAGCGPFLVSKNPGGVDSVTFTYKFFLVIPGILSGWSKVKISGTLSDGLLSFSHDDEPEVFMFREGAWDHPEIVESYDLVSVGGDPLPTGLDGGLILAGRLQLYSDETWTFVRRPEEAEMRPDTTGALPIPFAGRLEVVEEVGAESHLRFSFLDHEGNLDSMPGLLSDSVLTVVFEEDRLAFHKRR